MGCPGRPLIGCARGAYRRAARPPAAVSSLRARVAMARAALPLLLLLLSVVGLHAIQRVPRIQVYSRHPAENGKPNFLNCYVSGFHPPEITVDILKNGKEMDKVERSDLAFSKDWSFYLLAYTEFTPSTSDQYSCRVKHSTLTEPKIVIWDQDN